MLPPVRAPRAASATALARRRIVQRPRLCGRLCRFIAAPSRRTLLSGGPGDDRPHVRDYKPPTEIAGEEEGAGTGGGRQCRPREMGRHRATNRNRQPTTGERSALGFFHGCSWRGTVVGRAALGEIAAAPLLAQTKTSRLRTAMGGLWQAPCPNVFTPQPPRTQPLGAPVPPARAPALPWRRHHLTKAASRPGREDSRAGRRGQPVPA